MLYHTSPSKIDEFHERGLFGPYLFFSESPYLMTAAKDPHVYGIDDEQMSSIEARSIWYQEMDEEQRKKADKIVRDVMEEFDTDEDTAMALLDESEDIFSLMHEEENNEDLGNKSWWLQHQTAKLGTILGFDATEVTDEQGTSYMVHAKHSSDILKHLGLLSELDEE